MDTNFFDVLINTEEYKNNPFLLIEELPDTNDFSKKPDDRRLAFFGKAGNNIRVNQKFDIIFSKKNPKDYIKTKASITSIEIHPLSKVQILNRGECGLILMDFEIKIPKISTKIKPYNESNSSIEYDFLYLTNQILMDKIIELL